MYIGNYAVFTLRTPLLAPRQGRHLVKTRAIENRIGYNRITDENGTASYEIDIPDAGLSYVIGNLLEQSSGTQNPAILSTPPRAPAAAATPTFTSSTTPSSTTRSPAAL